MEENQDVKILGNVQRKFKQFILFGRGTEHSESVLDLLRVKVPLLESVANAGIHAEQ